MVLRYCPDAVYGNEFAQPEKSRWLTRCVFGFPSSSECFIGQR